MFKNNKDVYIQMEHTVPCRLGQWRKTSTIESYKSIVANKCRLCGHAC